MSSPAGAGDVWTSSMSTFFKAFVSTFLLVEIAAITLGTAVWAILSEMHFGQPFILGVEGIAGLGVLALGVAIFRRAISSEKRIASGETSE